LFAEMDAYWNPYSAYNENGTFRGSDHSTQAFRQAWRRITLILRGGAVGAIDARLHALRMPPIPAAGATLPRAYNQGYKVSGKLALEHYPASARTLARHLLGPVCAPFTPEWKAGGTWQSG
jgi:hypothetical protein